jgi:hypothetical protein
MYCNCCCTYAGKATQVTGVFGEDEDEDGSKAGPGPKSAAAAEAAGASKGGSKLDELMRKVSLVCKQIHA